MSLIDKDWIDGYKESLKELAEKDSTAYINNSSSEHAMAMIERLFLQAKGTVKIYSDHIKSEIYGNASIIRAADDFLRKSDSNRIEVIVQLRDTGVSEATLTENVFLRALSEYKDRIDIRRIKEGATAHFENHFMVTKTLTEKYALRYEIDKNKFVATGTFNNMDFGKSLMNLFDTIFGSAIVAHIFPENVWANEGCVAA